MPALDQLADNLEAIGAELPERAALTADAGYFSEDNLRITAQHGLDAHIATGRFKTQGRRRRRAGRYRRTPRPSSGWRASCARRRAAPSTPGAKRSSSPVFGQMDTVQDARQLLLRGQPAARAQWRFHGAIHNLLKLHRAGGLDLLRERNSALASPSAGKRRPLATLATVMHSLAAHFRRSFATMSAECFARIAPIPVTDPGS